MDVVSVTSLVGFWRAFWSLKWAESTAAILAAVTARHSWIIENGQKGGTWMKLSWNQARL